MATCIAKLNYSSVWGPVSNTSDTYQSIPVEQQVLRIVVPVFEGANTSHLRTNVSDIVAQWRVVNNEEDSFFLSFPYTGPVPP